MVCQQCGSIGIDGDCVCYKVVPELKGEIAKLRAEVERLKAWGQDGYTEALKFNSQAAVLELQVSNLKALILQGAPECPKDDPCSCMRCRIGAIFPARFIEHDA